MSLRSWPLTLDLMDYIRIAICVCVAAFVCSQGRMPGFFAPLKLGPSVAAEIKEEDPPERDPKYYFQASTVVFRIDNTLFRIHENFLSSEENTLCSRIRQSRSPEIWLDGSSDARAIVLDDIPIEEFRSLLYYFYYERTHQLARELGEVEYLQELLAVSYRTRMPEIFEYASNRLSNLQPPLPPHQRVSLYLRYEDSLSERDWLYPAVAELLGQVEPLDSEQARQVGLELLQMIACMREDMDGDGTFR
ncbi:hypothetical protein BJ322DRAFT_269031 [Thelephora terrestris]|uniref:BTB domain-containing protein n=1 Tax=Thelephora terrestris TaxID=56493 RepID=A0A9P6H8J4_9AGAM|nr:hypothetical protein BJ322DRAFT_269031 [Thelephora terrestris]